jgi:hypothetical protein
MSVRIKQESKWEDWSEPVKSSILIVIDFKDERITIYSKKKQVYDIIAYPGEKMIDKTSVFELECVNEDGDICTILNIRQENGTTHLIVDKTDYQIIYDTYLLD